MAIKQDGDQLFGIAVPEFDSMVVESFSLTTPANRVDLDDGNGEPLGSTVVPQRKEASLTVQMGAGVQPPVIGDEVPYGDVTVMVTGIDVTEAQADYRRYSISGYAKINA